MDQVVEQPVVQPISKGLYLGTIIGGFVFYILMIVLAIVLAASGGPDMEPVMAACFGLGIIAVLVATVMILVLVYKIWDAIQGGNPRTTPGKAVGFMFIPFFNLYWMFQVYWGWAQDYNQYAEELGISEPRMSEGMVLTMCILTFAGIVPFIGPLLSLAALVMFIIFYVQAINAVNALAAATGGTVDPMQASGRHLP